MKIEENSNIYLQERIFNLEKLVFYLTISLFIYWGTINNKFGSGWITLIPLFFLITSFWGLFSTFLNICFNVGTGWEKKLKSFYYKHKSKILFVVKWGSLVVATFIGIYFMGTSLKSGLGIIILSIIANYIYSLFKKKRE